jgi:AraC-like DNA-binding protein
MTARRFQEGADENPPGLPYVVLTGRRSLFVGTAPHFTTQRSAVLTIAIGLDAPIRWVEAGGVRRGEVLVLWPDHRGRLVAEGPLALLFTDPLSDRLPNHEWPSGSAEALRQLLLRGPVQDGEAFVAQCCALLGIEALGAPRQDIARTVQAIAASPASFGRLARAAALTGLSPARFRHVFAEVVGVSFTRFRLWRRMGIVIRTLAGGADLTEAALTAGFASSAHLSAAFRDLFGLSPSRFLATKARYVLSAAEPDARDSRAQQAAG